MMGSRRQVQNIDKRGWNSSAVVDTNIELFECPVGQVRMTDLIWSERRLIVAWHAKLVARSSCVCNYTEQDDAEWCSRRRRR